MREDANVKPVRGRRKITTGLLALLIVILNAGVIVWTLWAFRDPTAGYGAGIVMIFVALSTLLSALLGVMSLVDKSGRVPGTSALAASGAALLFAIYSMMTESP